MKGAVHFPDATMVTEVPEMIQEPCLMCGALAPFAVLGPARFMEVLNACKDHVERVRGVARGEALQ